MTYREALISIAVALIGRSSNPMTYTEKRTADVLIELGLCEWVEDNRLGFKILRMEQEALKQSDL